jgi:hypothetical protein
MNQTQRYEDALNATLSALDTSLHDDMPAGPYRDFFLWAISSENPHRDSWFETTGTQQIVRLSVALLDNLLDDEQWDYARLYYPLLNVFFIYECMSDNLAIGLADPNVQDEMAPQRRKLVYAFNNAMVNTAHTITRRAEGTLRPLFSDTLGISNFDQSLNREKFLTSALAFLETRDDLVLEDIEYSVWPVLVANMESFKGVIRAIHEPVNTLLRTGLGNRYWSINRQLDDMTMTLPELVNSGAWAILVAPTLAYYSVLMIEALQLDDRLAPLIETHALEEAVFDAALLVRLLNDLGPLVTLNAREQKAAIDLLMARYRKNPQDFDRIHDLLETTDEIRHLLTRIRKDVQHGEFNVALYNLADKPPMTALLTFQSRVAYFCQIYVRRREHLEQTLDAISKILGDDRISTMILRMITFHQVMYTYEHTTPKGEFAV